MTAGKLEGPAAAAVGEESRRRWEVGQKKGVRPLGALQNKGLGHKKEALEEFQADSQIRLFFQKTRCRDLPRLGGVG